jgi:hypothetical protein
VELLSRKITKRLADAILRAGEAPLRCAVDVAVDHDRLPLSSFAARATAKDAAVMAGITAIMGTVQAWEATHGTTIEVGIRATEGIVDLVAPRGLLEAIAELDEVAALEATAPVRASTSRSR